MRRTCLSEYAETAASAPQAYREGISTYMDETTRERNGDAKKTYTDCKLLDAGPEGMYCNASGTTCAAFMDATGGYVWYPKECEYCPPAKMQQFESGAVRESRTGKGRCDLLPMCVLLRMARHYENTDTPEHPARNWEKGMPTHVFMDSALRHIFKYMDGQTNEDHLSAAIWNLFGCAYMEEKHPDQQDIPSRMGVSNLEVLKRYMKETASKHNIEL